VARGEGAGGAARRASPGAPPRSRPIERAGEHRAEAPGDRPVACVVITVSDTRRGKADQGGALVAGMIEQAGHRVAARAWVKDEPDEIRRAVNAAFARREVDCVILTGGTGLSPRDRTPESLDPLFEKPLPGFGELFRVLSLKQVGAAAWLSRATAGIARGRLVVTLPGSTAAVELALRQLLLPELAHAMRALGRFHREE
jgi:molybdenum cofactor biosynthesis protein B